MTVTDNLTSGRTSAAPSAIGSRHQHDVVFSCHACHHLNHPRIFGTGHLLDPLQQRHFVCAAHGCDGIKRRVQLAGLAQRGCTSRLDAAGLARRRDGADGRGRIHQRQFGNVIRVGKAVFSPLTARMPTPWSMLKLPDFTMPFQAPSLGSGVLEIEVSVIHAMRGDLRQRAADAGLAQAKGLQQQVLRLLESEFRWGFDAHARIVGSGLKKDGPAVATGQGRKAVVRKQGRLGRTGLRMRQENLQSHVIRQKPSGVESTSSRTGPKRDSPPKGVGNIAKFMTEKEPS